MRKINCFLIFALCAIAFTSCAKTDVPDINFYHEEMNVPAEGGDFVVKVSSTGVDDVYSTQMNFEYDENGDLVPGEVWLVVNKVIYHYDENATRDLPSYISGIDITVKPNTTGKSRRARLYARSFSKTDYIEIVQAAN